MTEDRFKPTFLALCEMFDRGDVSPELTKMYFKVLDGAGMSDDDFVQAVGLAMTNITSGDVAYKSIPLPADLLKLMEPVWAESKHKALEWEGHGKFERGDIPPEAKEAMDKLFGKNWNK